VYDELRKERKRERKKQEAATSARKNWKQMRNLSQ
jgi:hypothetical protein